MSAGDDPPDSPLDCLVIGAGPAGLTAAVYLARYRRTLRVVHDGESRALRIPLTHNAPGFPDGVSGPDLMDRMTRQAQRYGADITLDPIARLESLSGGGFVAHGAGGPIACRTVILATGVRLAQAVLPHDAHEAAVAAGCLRYCPICDGFEAVGKAVGVLGADKAGAAEALFLRRFSDDVTLIPRTITDLAPDERAQLEAAGVTVIDAPVDALEPDLKRRRMTVRLTGRAAPLSFDVLYPALGCQPRSELVRGMDGVDLTDQGCVPTDAHQATTLPGLFAAGDVVEALDQISVAAGHGAVAATQAHNYLRALDGESLG